MPTKLAQLGYRRFDYQGRGSRAAGLALAPNVIWLRGPWPGYEPSVSSSEATQGSALDCAGLMDRDGFLTQQNGFAKLASATLPLGGTSPPDVGSEEPVVCIAEGRDSTTQAVQRYVITADTAGNGRGHFYELISGVWTEQAFNNTSGGNAFTGDASDPASTLADSAHFTAANYTVFASGEQNNLLRFPGLTVADEYEQLAGLGALTNLGANSICSAEERLLAFGTNEGSTYYPTRFRWTSKGASGSFDPTSTGAGFAEVAELGGEAAAIRPIGPKIALYTTTGGMLVRRTGITTDAFAKDYQFPGRGLLSTHSVCDVGNGIHFGLFTDGWFMLRYDGVWEERGKVGSGSHKWRREFYGTLDWENRARIITRYDENDHIVYIAFPQAGTSGNGPSVVWLYDTISDTCWPAPDWTKKPNCFGTIIEEASAGYTWATVPGTWSGGSGSWASFDSTTGQRRVHHGTADGYVYYHHPALVEQDNVLPTYRYTTHYFSGEQPNKFRRVEAIHVNYNRVQADNGADPTPITLTYSNENGTSETGSILQTSGTVNTIQTDFASPGVVSGVSHKVSLSGTAPVKITGVGIQVAGDSGSLRKEGST